MPSLGQPASEDIGVYLFASWGMMHLTHMARALRLARARRKDAGESRVQAVSAGRVDIVSCFTTVTYGFAFQAVNDKWVTLLHVIPASFIRRDDVDLQSNGPLHYCMQ